MEWSSQKESFNGMTLGEQLKACVNKLLNDKELWKEIKVDKGNFFKDDEIKMWIGPNEIAKCQIKYELPAALLWDLLLYPEEQTHWDTFCTEAKIIEEFDVSNDIAFYTRVLSVPSIPCEIVLYRYNTSSVDQSEFFLCFRSVESEKAPLRKEYHRIELYPSGIHVKKDSQNPMHCICTMIMNGDIAQANAKVNVNMLDSPPLTNVSYLLSTASNLKRYSQLPKDHFARYTLHIANRTCKGIADLFVDWTVVDEKNNWKKVIKQPNIAIWAKQFHDRDILCNTGIFELNMRPRDVFDILMEGIEDPFQTSNVLIEVINEMHQIRHISWKSTTSLEIHDSVILHCGRISLDGLHILAMRSVVHSAAPISPFTRRMEILPSGYFIHPIKGGEASLIVYCVQVDVKQISSTPDARANAEKMFTLRALGMRNALKKLRPKNTTENGNNSKPYSKMALISTLCSMFLEHSEQRQILSHQLKMLTSQNSNTQSINTKKRKEVEETSDDSDEDKQLPPIQSLFSGSSVVNAINYHKRAFTVSIHENSEQNITFDIRPCYISMLPDELLLHMLQFLGSSSIGRFSSVCKKFLRITEDWNIWKHYFSIRFPNIRLPNDTNWKEAYRRRVTAAANWKRGKFRTQVLRGHTKAVRNMAIDGDLILSGSSDRQVKLWKASTGEVINSLSGPNAGVIALGLRDEMAAVGYGNGLMRVWNIFTSQTICEKQFSFSTKGEIFVSWDETIDIWELQTGKLVKSLNEHKRVNNIEMKGGSDKLVKKWDLETGTCLNTFLGHTSGINAVDLDENFVVSCGNDRLVKLWDSRSNSCVANYVGHVAGVKCVRLGENRIVSGGSDNTVRVWDRFPSNSQESQNLIRLDAQDSPVLSLKFDEFKIACGDSDGNVILYHFD